MRGAVLFFSIAVLLVSVVPLALPQNTAVAQGSNVTRTLPDTVVRGGTFNVTVTFITPVVADVINLWDCVPVGWSVQVNKQWCNPSTMDALLVKNNSVWAQWSGGFPVNTTFTCLYKVTVPADATPGIYNFSEQYFRYHLPGDPVNVWTYENITGDSRVIIGPWIAVNPSSLAFSAGLRGAPPANQTLLIWNSGSGDSLLNWTLSEDAPWLNTNVTSGSSVGGGDKTPVGVAVNITGKSAGDYSANITITDPLAGNSPRRVPVTLHISAPRIYVTPSIPLAFGAVQGGLAPGNQTLFIWNSGDAGTTLNWTLSDDAAWLDENVTSGNSTGEADKAPVEVSVNITGKSAGDYSANITITDTLASNSPQVVPVTLHISAPEIYVTPSIPLAFGAVQGGLPPGNQTLVIWNSGGSGSVLSWELSDDVDWLDENVTSGSSSGEDDKTAVEVSVNITGKSVGDYSANITITDPLASNSPRVVPVTLHINQSSSGGGGGGGGGSRPRTIRGDVNGDGVVDELDLTLERGIILGLDDVTDNADCNGDGKVNVLDITTIKRIIVGRE